MYHLFVLLRGRRLEGCLAALQQLSFHLDAPEDCFEDDVHPPL